MTDPIEAMAIEIDKTLTLDIESDVLASQLTREEQRKVATAALAVLSETHLIVPKEGLVPMGWVKLDGNGGWLVHSPYKTTQAETPLYTLEGIKP